MESHRHASGASDHSESMASSREQHCSQMSQQMIFNTSSQGHSRHVSGLMLPQQSHTVVPQQCITAEQNMHYGQAQRTLADHQAISSGLTGETSPHGQLTSSVPPNVQTYSEVKSHQRHGSSHEPSPVYGNMSGPVMTMPGQAHHSPKAIYQNIEGMIVSGHIPGGDGHVPQGGYYPVPYQGQRMSNSGQISWQSPRHFMSCGGQGAVSGQVFVSGVQARFNSQVSVPFRGQQPQYAFNQYGEVCYQQHQPVFGELNRGTFSPQQHCVGPNGQRIMFARPSMHIPHHHPRMPADAQFVYYAPHTGSGASQQLSSSWSGSTHMMRSGVPVGYCNQQPWQRPVAVAYGNPPPGQRMPDYHLSAEPRMNAEFCDGFAGVRQHSSPSHSFSPGSLRCYRPCSNQGPHAGVMCADEKYLGANVQPDGNANSAVSPQNCVSPAVASINVSTAAICSTAGSDISSKVLSPATTLSHPLEHLPDGRTSLTPKPSVSGTSASRLSSYNQSGYYLHGTNVNGLWSVSAAGAYSDYNTASQYTSHTQHSGRHVNPYNYYASPSVVPYSGTPHYPLTRCGHPYQSHSEGMHWQGQVVEHPLHEHRNVLPDKVASRCHLEQESLTTVTSTTCCVSDTVTCSALHVSGPLFLTSAPMTITKVDKQNFDNADKVQIARTVAVQLAATDTGHCVPFSGSLDPVKDPSTQCFSDMRSMNCSPICTVSVATATGTVVTLSASTVDSTTLVPPNDAAVVPANSDIQVLLVHDKQMEDTVAGATGTDSHNCLQITSSTLSSTCKSSKGPKRSGSRKGTTKTKKKKTSLSLDTPIDSDNVSTVTAMKTAPRAESIDPLCPVTSNCTEQIEVVVPYGWRRHVDGSTVVYYSPSNISLRSHDEVRQYLLKEGTCKCGLQCPLVVDKTFVFDAQQTRSKHLLADDIHAASDQSNSLCNHRRKILAMAAFQQSTGFRFTKPESMSASRLPVQVMHTTEATVITSVSEVKSTYPLLVHNQSSEESTSLSSSATAHLFSNVTMSNSVTTLSTISNQSTLGIPQSYSRCHVGPGAESSSEKCSTGPVKHVHYGSAPTYGHSQITAQTPRIMGHSNSPYYHPSTDFQARLSSSYRQMATFAPSRMPYATSAGYAMYDRGAVHMAGSFWSGNVQSPRQFGGLCGSSAPAISNTAVRPAIDLPSTVSDTPEPVRTPASMRSKKKSRAQSKESYSSILERAVPCPNIDVRQIIQEQRERLQMEVASCSSVSVHCLTGVSTMPTAATLHATAASTLQQMVTLSSQNLPVTSNPSPSVNDGSAASSSSSLCAMSEVSCTSLSVTISESVLSSQVSSVDTSNSLHVLTTLSSVSISPAICYITTSTAEVVHISATSLSCGTSSVCTGVQQYHQWSQYSNHPLSSMHTTKPSVGMNLYQNQFDCSPGQQVSSIQTFPVLQPHFASGMLSPAVTVTTSAVANSACLPGGAMLQSLASEIVDDESPIRLVQNMVSGLETTQNSLAMATSLIISQSDSVPRRRKSGAMDAAGHITTNVAITDLHDEVRFDSKLLDVDEQINSSVPLPIDSFRCTQSKVHLPTTYAVTTVTSVLTQVLPVASVIPSAYCIRPLPSVSIHPAVSPVSATPSLCSDTSHTVSFTAISSTSDVESTAVSGTSDVDMYSTCYSAHTACSASASDGGTAQQLIDSQVVDDDESTQDCDVSVAGTDSGDVLCTTGTQTSTPASGMSNCNSIESGVDGSESNDTVGPMIDDVLSAELQSDIVACDLPAPQPSVACEEKPPDDGHPEQITVPTSTPVVLIPRVPQASFLLPQNIAFAPNPLIGHGFLQFQPPGEFGYGAAVQSSGASAVGQPGALGLVHFAAGPMVGPAVGNMMTTSDAAAGSFRLMTPVKSDGDVYSAAEFLPLMPAAMPAGHILLQNIVPTGLASTIVPFVQPAALCSLPVGSSALFAVSQGSVMSVGAPLAFASVPVPEQRHQPRDHAPDQPDSTVDNSEMDTTDERSSDDSADTEQVTSTDEPLDEVSDNPIDSPAKVAAPTLRCSTSHGIHTSLTKNVQCSSLQCGSNTSTRTEYDSVHSDEKAGTSITSHSTVHRSLSLMPSMKKRSQLGRSRLKKLRHGHGRSTLPSSTVDQTSCSLSESSLNVPTSVMMSPAGSDEFVDSLCSGFHAKDTAASDSSVSTTLSLHDASSVDVDPSTGGQYSCRAGSVQKARWKKQALARRTRLRLRHSKHEVKPTADERLTPTETTHVEDVADSTTGSVPTCSPRTFNIGDLVWGPSRGFPSWPGKLVTESEVRGNHKLESGKIWVKWFGDHTFAQADPDQLKTLSEGLETHHNARKKDRQGRKMNSNLEAAIQEAMSELDRQMAEQSAVRSSSSASERSQKSHDGKKRK